MRVWEGGRVGGSGLSSIWHGGKGEMEDEEMASLDKEEEQG